MFRKNEMDGLGNILYDLYTLNSLSDSDLKGLTKFIPRDCLISLLNYNLCSVSIQNVIFYNFRNYCCSEATGVHREGGMKHAPLPQISKTYGSLWGFSLQGVLIPPPP